MISIEKAKRYCREDISHIKNYELAIADNERVWECHHINGLTFTHKELIKMKMYYNRPASELIFLTESEHMKLHSSFGCYAETIRKNLSLGPKDNFKGKHHTKETKDKISKALSGRTFSDEWRKKLSLAQKGKKHKLGSIFGEKFKEHYGLTKSDNPKLYSREHHWYKKHNKCRWE